MEVELGKWGQEGSSTNSLETEVFSFCLSASLAYQFYLQQHHKASEASANTSAIQAMRRQKQGREKEQLPLSSLLDAPSNMSSYFLLLPQGCILLQGGLGNIVFLLDTSPA